jgi:predicted DNA binding protein
MLIPPITFHDGWETHRLVSREQESLRRMVEAVERWGEIEVLSQRRCEHSELIKDMYVVPTHFIDGLTPRQVNVMVNSYEAGLFDVPARAKMEDVARQCGLSRSTFGEHLRKGQLQVMQNLYPLLKLRCCRDEPGLATGAGGGPHSLRVMR